MKSFKLEHKVIIEESAVFAAIEAVETALEPYDVPGPLSFKLHLALEEVLLNLVHHTELTEQDAATVCIEQDQDVLSLTVMDAAAAFDPLAAAAPDLSLDVDDRPVGGLGIHLLKESTQSMTYQRSGGMNILQLTWCGASDSSPVMHPWHP